MSDESVQVPMMSEFGHHDHYTMAMSAFTEMFPFQGGLSDRDVVDLLARHADLHLRAAAYLAFTEDTVELADRAAALETVVHAVKDWIHGLRDSVDVVSTKTLATQLDHILSSLPEGLLS